MSDRLTFGLMRAARAVIGTYSFCAFFTALATIIQVAAGNVGFGALLFVLALFAASLAAFVGMRRWINAVHQRRHGSPHPRMTRFAAL